MGRIDRAAFERGVPFRVPVWLGNGVLLLGALAGALAVALAMATSSQTLAGLALLFAGGAWSVAFHDPAHWLVGRAVGIRFTCYFVTWRPFPPRPGLKTDYATYLRASPTARAWMHAAGALATKLAPFVALAFWPATDAPRVGGLGAARPRRDPDPHRRAVLRALERLEEGPPGAPGGASAGLEPLRRSPLSFPRHHRGARTTGLRGGHNASATRRT